MKFDFNNVLRRTRTARKTTSLTRTDRSDLPLAEDLSPLGATIMLDTCVYIDILKDTTPATVDALLALANVRHSSVALSELAITFGILNPKDTRSQAVLTSYEKFINGIADYQVSEPSAASSTMGAIRAGTIARCHGYSDQDRKNVMNDGIIAAHAVEKSAVLVTRNIADFDYLSQLDPMFKVVFYDKVRAT